jgi:hypothetical protein
MVFLEERGIKFTAFYGYSSFVVYYSPPGEIGLSFIFIEYPPYLPCCTRYASDCGDLTIADYFSVGHVCNYLKNTAFEA